MKISRVGFIGVGKMGQAMIEKLAEAGFKVMAFDFDKEKLKEAGGLGAAKAKSISDLAKGLKKPKAIWLMLPEGQFIDEIIFGKYSLAKLLSKGDVIIDGGNSNFRDSMRRAGALKKKGIAFLDVGVSGGVHGAEHGLCMMIGGEKRAYELCKSSLKVCLSQMGVSDILGKAAQAIS